MNTPIRDDAPVRALIEQAEAARKAGRREETLQAWEEVLKLSPDHPGALNAVAMHALSRGDAAAARQMLERATAQERNAAQLELNLALACAAGGDLDGEMAAIERALKIEPRSYISLLQKGSSLERRGQPKAAARVYRMALAILSTVGRFPAALQGAVARASEAVRADSVGLDTHLQNRLHAMREKHPGTHDRFDHTLDAMLGKKRIYVQQPTGMHVPRLPAIQFYDRRAFPWLEALEARSAVIAEEALRLIESEAKGFEPYIAYPDGQPLNQWKELNRSPRWSAYYFWRDGKRLDDHLAACPQTAATLASAPTADIPGRAPTAFYSLLRPKTRIPAHTGVTNARLIVHLPLIVPPNCGFRVGSEAYEWKTGRAWVFDDTIEHEAWNDSDQPRLILIFDIWNPFLNEAEKDLLRTAVSEIQSYYGSEPGAALADDSGI